MTNTLCACANACVHVIGDGAVRGTSFEHRQVPAARDEPAVNEPLVAPDEVEAFVRSVLARAAGNADRIEYAGTASTAAYMALAEQRGVSWLLGGGVRSPTVPYEHRELSGGTPRLPAAGGGRLVRRTRRHRHEWISFHHAPASSPTPQLLRPPDNCQLSWSPVGGSRVSGRITQ